MKSVYKYTLQVNDEWQKVRIPGQSKIVHVAQQENGSVCFWALVDNTIGDDIRSFRIYGTGHQTPESGYIGTALMHSGLVWHVFERLTDED
mgnify:CR=1 FL=1